MKKIIFILLFSIFSISSVVSQATTDDYLTRGLQAYKDGNWESAILLLKNAVSLPEVSTPEVLYVLVMSEMFNGNYQDVLKDGKTFGKLYPTSEYKVYVDYQMGRALHYLGRYVDSISVLQKFCAENEKNEEPETITSAPASITTGRVLSFTPPSTDIIYPKSFSWRIFFNSFIFFKHSGISF